MARGCWRRPRSARPRCRRAAARRPALARRRAARQLPRLPLPGGRRRRSPAPPSSGSTRPGAAPSWPPTSAHTDCRLDRHRRRPPAAARRARPRRATRRAGRRRPRVRRPAAPARRRPGRAPSHRPRSTRPPRCCCSSRPGSTGRAEGGDLLDRAGSPCICQVDAAAVRRRDDVAYNAMPMFHGNALMASLGAAPGARARRFATRRTLLRVRLPARRPALTAPPSSTTSAASLVLRPAPSRSGPTSASNRLTLRLRHRGVGARPRGVRATLRLPGRRVLRIVRRAICSIRRAARDARRARSGCPPSGADVDGASTPRRARSARRRASTRDGRLLNADEAIGEIVGARRRRRASRATTTTPRPTAEQDPRRLTTGPGDLAYRDEDGVVLVRRAHRGLAAGRLARTSRPRRSSGSSARHPGRRRASRCTRVPDPRTGDQVMATLAAVDAGDAVRPRRVRGLPRRPAPTSAPSGRRPSCGSRPTCPSPRPARSTSRSSSGCQLGRAGPGLRADRRTATAR